jgi:hypothetical protein
MFNQKKTLKGWVRFDGNNNAVAGSLIFRKNKPKVGNWKEYTDVNLCCSAYTLLSNVVPGTPPDTLCVVGFAIYCDGFSVLSATSTLNLVDVSAQAIADGLNAQFSFLGTWVVVSTSEVGLQFKQTIADSLCPNGVLTIEFFCGG